MNRIVVIISFGWIFLMAGCADATKPVDSVSKEEVATAQMSKATEKPVLTITDDSEITEVKESVSQPPAKEVVEKPAAKAIVKKKPVRESTPLSKPATNQVEKTFANISFDKTVHEFGEIDEGDKITHKFKFKNTGNGPLTIDNVDVSCGCTMPTYPIIPIGPGESGEIGVIYNSKGKFGTQKPSITVKTNATQPIVKLYMSGSIKHVFEKPVSDTTLTKG